MQKTLSINSKRDPYWDNIKGVLIILVVFTHCIYYLRSYHINKVILDAVYYFHMPAFLFVSGYFSKSENSRSRLSLLKLFVSYVFFITPFVIQAMLLGKRVILFSPYYSSWYLLALMILRLLVPYLASFKYILPASLFFTVVVGFWADISSASVISLKKIVVYLPFFIAGYLLSSETLNNTIRSKSLSFRYLAGAVTVSLMLIAEKYTHRWFHISFSDLHPGKYKAVDLEQPMIRISVILVSFLAIASLLLFSIEREIPFLTKIGRNTLSIFLVHRFPALLYSKSELIASWPAAYQLAGAAVVTLLITLSFGSDRFSKWFNNLIGNCARSISNQPGTDSQKFGIYKLFFLLLLLFLFIAPVICRFMNQ